MILLPFVDSAPEISPHNNDAGFMLDKRDGMGRT
jgi:hypothetical protein